MDLAGFPDIMMSRLEHTLSFDKHMAVLSLVTQVNGCKQYKSMHSLDLLYPAVAFAVNIKLLSGCILVAFLCTFLC